MTMNAKMSEVRELTMDELDAVSGGTRGCEFSGIAIDVAGKGTLVVGTVTCPDGTVLPSAGWSPKKPTQK
jgi:hypothetical protein